MLGAYNALLVAHVALLTWSYKTQAIPLIKSFPILGSFALRWALIVQGCVVTSCLLLTSSIGPPKIGAVYCS